jgi:hypothetical protein
MEFFMPSSMQLCTLILEMLEFSKKKFSKNIFSAIENRSSFGIL